MCTPTVESCLFSLSLVFVSSKCVCVAAISIRNEMNAVQMFGGTSVQQGTGLADGAMFKLFSMYVYYQFHPGWSRDKRKDTRNDWEPIFGVGVRAWTVASVALDIIHSHLVLTIRRSQGPNHLCRF